MTNEVAFYGGHIICMQGSIKVENLDFILDLLDEYIELTERQDMRGKKKETTFDDYLKEQLKDPAFREEWEKLCDEDMQRRDEEE